MVKKGKAKMLEKFSLPGSESKYQDPEVQPAGFWAGVWHGSMIPFSFLVSLFKPGVGVYETRNVGKWYNFGYLIGASIAFGPKRQVVINKNGHADEDEEDE
jgi:hypothetical protein